MLRNHNRTVVWMLQRQQPKSVGNAEFQPTKASSSLSILSRKNSTNDYIGKPNFTEIGPTWSAPNVGEI